MKKLLFTLMLVVMSSSAMAEWVEVGSSYIGYASIKTTPYAFINKYALYSEEIPAEASCRQ